jgi:GntR family transcriptional regulator/MocR family aminotransferase
MGTFNKTWFPALRLAYMILPGVLVETFHRTRGIGGQHPPAIDQAAERVHRRGALCAAHRAGPGTRA